MNKYTWINKLKFIPYGEKNEGIKLFNHIILRHRHKLNKVHAVINIQSQYSHKYSHNTVMNIVIIKS